MDDTVILESLLDFGFTGWLNSNFISEFHEIDFSNTPITGKYGIGFFSVFMVCDRVDVVTRRFDKSFSDTVVLTFGSGLATRPILRKATKTEQIAEGGTQVRLYLRNNPYMRGGLLGEAKYRSGAAGLCAKLSTTYAAICFRRFL